MPAFMGPMCTEDPQVNSKKADACLDIAELDARMCVYNDALGGTYLFRHGCYGDWLEIPDDGLHVP